MNSKVAIGMTLAALTIAGIFLLRPSPAVDASEAEPSADAPRASEGTRRMVERLRALADEADPEANPFLSEERAAAFRARTPEDTPRAELEHRAQLATELLNAGRTAEALEMLEAAWDRIEPVAEWRESELGLNVHSFLALAHLRSGEQENCVQRHDTESCLLPIRGTGVHREQSGSRAGIEVLTAILEHDPEDLGARWLLNVAYMTVGEYPGGVPSQWLIPPQAFESDYDIGRFPDVSAEAGLEIEGLAGAALMEDFDGDDYLDLLVTSWGLRDQMRYFRNERDGTFSERTHEAGLTGIVSGLNAVHADYDNDGDVDVFLPRGAWLRKAGLLPPSLLRNRGDGSFDDVTEEAGLLAFYSSQAAAWGDYDGDGWLDLYVATESGADGPTSVTMLYRNEGDGTFTDVARAVGVAALGFFKGVVWGDYDDDGRPDLYVTAIEDGPANILFHNDGPRGDGGWQFSDVTEAAGVLGPEASFPTWFFDYDNDGRLDLFASGYAGTVADIAADYLGIGEREDGETPRLYHNQGDGTFRDVTREAGLETVLMTMGCNFGDLDNDGWLDFYAATGNPDFRTLVPNRMFRNAGGKAFQDVTTSGGFGHLQKGHAVAFGDLDNDGDQDVFLKVGGAYPGDAFPSALFENPGHGNHWVTLRLVGVESNRSAIGARIKLIVEEPTGPREIHASVTTGSSFGGSTLRQEIGLGRAQSIRSVEIRWPSGARQVFEDVPMDRMLDLREGAAAPVEITLQRLHLGGHPR